MFTSILGVGLRCLLQNDLNLRALTRHGTQDELTADLLNSFFHSYQSEPFVFRVQVKSNAVIHKTELDFIRGDRQSGSESLRLRVFDRVRDRLLGDSQQALLVLSRNGSRVALRLEIGVQVR